MLELIIAYMGYDPEKYKDLFPLGLFEFKDKPIATWFDSHRLFALNAVPQEKYEKFLSPGFKVEKGHIKQGEGFSNFMIFEIDLGKRALDIEFFKDKMYYPLEAFEKLESAKLVTNAGYFYLTDDEKADPVAPPKVRTGNLVIENGELINLPILDRSAIVILKDGSVNIKFLEGRGELLLNGGRYAWVGSKSKNKGEPVTIYNSSNIDIPIVNDPVMGPSRVAKKTYIKAGPGFTLAVCKRSDGRYVVGEVLGSEVLINDKDMVMEVPESLGIKAGDTAEFLSVDGLNLKDVKTAVSTGPMLLPSFEEVIEQVKKEFSIPDMANPNNPHEETKKLARGCLVKLKDGRICSIVIDGIPQAGGLYPGVTLKELVEFIKVRYPDYESAVATDPSSSVKAVFDEEGKVEVFGNLHYLAHKKDKSGKLEFWPNGRLGRKFNSALVVY